MQHLEGSGMPVLYIGRRFLKVKHDIEARSCNHCRSRKVKSITHSVCVFVALFIQNAKRMSRIMLSYVACLTLQYFSTWSHKWYFFRKKSY
jgi:uncharacterized membrane protein